MKKLFALLLAVLMIATMSVTAFAATVDTETTETITVTGTYQAGSAEDVISVDISWGSMAFTYTAGTQEWDPETHTYTETTAGTWTCAEGANEITMTNHSNVSISIECEFAATAGNDIKGAFYLSNGQQSGSENYSMCNMASAAEEGWLGNTSAPTSTRYFKITEGTISANSDNLGTITLTITNLGQ